jgi:hypothetical protein
MITPLSQHTSFLPHYLAQSDCLAADRQGQADTRLTLTPSVIPNSNYVIMVSYWNCLKYFCVFFWCCNHQVHRDFFITLYDSTNTSLWIPKDYGIAHYSDWTELKDVRVIQNPFLSARTERTNCIPLSYQDNLSNMNSSRSCLSVLVWCLISFGTHNTSNILY